MHIRLMVITAGHMVAAYWQFARLLVRRASRERTGPIRAGRTAMGALPREAMPLRGMPRMSPGNLLCPAKAAPRPSSLATAFL